MSGEEMMGIVGDAVVWAHGYAEESDGLPIEFATLVAVAEAMASSPTGGYCATHDQMMPEMWQRCPVRLLAEHAAEKDGHTLDTEPCAVGQVAVVDLGEL